MSASIDLRATALALVLTLVALSASAQTTRDITVGLGEQSSISAEGVRSYSEGTPGIVDVRLTDDETQFILVGRRAGTTSLLLIMRDGSQVQYRMTVPGGETPEEQQTGVQPRENIRLDLYFVQLSDSFSISGGINWPESLGSDASQGTVQVDWQRGSPTTTAVTLVAQSVLPRIDLAHANGWARLYRQAAVITANGEQASFQSGGEINVLVSGGLSAQLETVSFGTTIRCTPRFDPETGRIEIQLSADVSDLADDRGTGVPGRLVNSVQTLVNLELGQALVLGGIIARSEQRSRSGLPGLSQIPILGALFGVHSRRFEESESLLFIVPSVVNPTPITQRNRIEEAIRVYEEFHGGVDETELLEQPRVGGRAPRTAQ